MDWTRDELVPTYLTALDDVASVAHSLQDDEWDLPTHLDGWSVQDNVAHQVGIEAELLGRPLPDSTPDWSRLSHVDPENPMQTWTEAHVDVRRSMPAAVLLAEMDEVFAARRVEIAASPDGVDDEVLGPAGWKAPLWRVATIRAFDAWAHEQDIRRAVGRPGNVDGAGARAALLRLQQGLPYVVGKELAPPAGTSVRWVVDGPLSLTSTVVVGDDGRAAEVSSYDGEPTVRLRTPWENFVLIGCGRSSADLDAVVVTGDADLAARLLAVSAITP